MEARLLIIPLLLLFIYLEAFIWKSILIEDGINVHEYRVENTVHTLMSEVSD